jgi:hypothetical protein
MKLKKCRTKCHFAFHGASVTEKKRILPLAERRSGSTNHIFFKGENSKIKCGVSLVTPH